jgi:mannitol/fructose-specific phosphotransferase system IIA component
MKIKAITFGKTINIGNYQTIKVEVTIEAEDGENSAVVYQAAKDFIAKKEVQILNESKK